MIYSNRIGDWYFLGIEVVIMDGLYDDLFQFCKWIAISIFLGIIVGSTAVLFHFSVDVVTEFRIEHPYIILGLPLGGIFIAWFYKVLGEKDNKGTNFVHIAVRENKLVSPSTAPLIFISTLITHFFGGSSGREGAALQLGSSIADFIGKFIKLDEKDMSIITICGMCTAFAALFGTPITAAIFSIEVVSVGIMHYSALFPCLLAAATGCMIAEYFGVPPTSFVINGIPDVSVLSILEVTALSVLGALLSIIFCFIMHRTTALYKKKFSSPYKMAAAGGIVVIILTFIVGNQDYNGAGMHIINRAFEGNVVWYAFILKMIFTAATLGAGFKGGEIIPVFFTGATFGNFAAPHMGLSPSFGAGIGLIAVFCGVTNCPISSIMLSIELFGTEGLMFFAIVCAIGYMLSGYTGLYSEQKLLYSKTRAEYINRKAE